MRTRTLLVTAAATAALVVGSVGTAQAAVRDAAASAAPAGPTAHVRAVSGAFTYEMTASATSIRDMELFGAVRDGFGTGARPSVAADAIRSMGFVAGGTSFETGVSGAHLSGVAGDDVVAVTVIPAPGVRVPATLSDGLWAAAWQGDPGADGGRATVEYVTRDGRHRTVSTDEIDWIAAEQRQAARG